MAASNAARLRPLPFHFDNSNLRDIPRLDDDEFDDIVVTLKTLSKGKYPRQDAVPTALNAYNCGQPDKPWAYFHPVTSLETLADGSWKEFPLILLPDALLEDLGRPWKSIRFSENYNSSGESSQSNRKGDIGGGSSSSSGPSVWAGAGARYRFLCFIHEHKLSLRPNSRRSVYTISIWDREWDELTWHDTYHVGRSARRLDARQFWRTVAIPGFAPLRAIAARASGMSPPPMRSRPRSPRDAFLTRVRFRTVYHASERLADAMRELPPPRHTLWSVMAVGLHHMNRGGDDPQAAAVPDTLEYFAGHGRDLLPRLFAHLLCLCLDTLGLDDEPGPEGEGDEGKARQQRDEEEKGAFVRQFRVTEHLSWMRTQTRKHLEAHLPWDTRDWVLEALRI